MGEVFVSSRTDEERATGGAWRDSERFAYATLDALSEHVVVLDERGTVVAVNRAWREFAGANSLSPEGLSEGANYFDACESARGVGAADAARFAKGLRAVVAGELDEFSLEYPCHSPAERRWFIARATRFELDDEVRAVVTHANITARKLAEEATRFRSHLLDTVEQAVIATDLSGTITYWNRFAETLYGWPAAEIVGRNIIEVMLPEAMREQAVEIMSRLQEGQSWSGEMTVRRRDGTTFPAYITDAPIYDDEGAVVGFVGVSNDITERRRTERLLDAQKQSLEMVVTGVPLAEVLTYLTRVVEQQSDGRAVASILLLDEEGRLRNGASPSLPDDYLDAIDGLKADPNVGTCSAAASTGRPVVTPDIAADPKWEGIKHPPLGLGFNSAWSMPITARDGRVLGTFGTYFRERREPVALERQVVEILARTAALAIERNRAEEDLRESEGKYRLLLEQASDGIHTYDLRGNFIETNLRLCEMLGYTREELLRLNVKDIIPPEDLARAPLRFDELRAGRTLITERRLLRKDGTLLPVEISGRMVQDGVLQSIIRDISERKGAERELHEAYDELERRVKARTAELARANATLKEENAERLRAEEGRKELLRRLVSAQEEERRRISRELHDQMGQQLAALMMGLKALDADSHGRQSALRTLRQLQELTDELAREVHTLAWGLRPPALDDLGLHTALSNYVEEWAERSRVPVDFHSAGFDGGRLPLSHETALYRIAQEALTNVFKHSGADRVSFILERRGDHVLVVVEDNGKGFDVEAPPVTSAKCRKLGLLGMRERAAMLGGTLDVESAHGAGTTVFVRIPVAACGDEGGGGARE